MVISRLVKQKRHPDRVNLYVDGVFILGIHRDVAVRFGLRKGEEISREILEKLKISEEYSLARSKAFRLLKSRLRSEKELRIKLHEKEFSPSVIEEVIQNFITIGLIDDDKFARAFIHDALLKKASSRRMLQQQLNGRGVSSEIIKNALSDLLTEDEEEALLARAAKLYVIRLRNSRKIIAEEKIRHRTVQFLLRRGFSLGQIVKAIKPYFQNHFSMGEY